MIFFLSFFELRGDPNPTQHELGSLLLSQTECFTVFVSH
jgi:hypothetical protein